MSILREVLTVSSIIAFAYFAILNATYLVFTAIAWRDVTRYRRAPVFERLSEAGLRAYVNALARPRPDGQVELTYSP